MAGNSGRPEKQMDTWISNSLAQIKRQLIKEENARLKFENEMLREQNRAMSQMQRRNPCATCLLKMENARLRAELERVNAIAALQKAIAKAKGELGSSSTAFKFPESNETGSHQEPGTSVPRDELPSK